MRFFLAVVRSPFGFPFRTQPLYFYKEEWGLPAVLAAPA